MYFWDWRSGYNFQKLNSIAQPGSINSEAGIFALAFDRSGSRLVTAEADKTIKVYKEDETAVNARFSALSISLWKLIQDFFFQTEETHPTNWRPGILRKAKY